MLKLALLKIQSNLEVGTVHNMLYFISNYVNIMAVISIIILQAQLIFIIWNLQVILLKVNDLCANKKLFHYPLKATAVNIQNLA